LTNEAVLLILFQLKPLLIRDKDFLKSLYSAKSPVSAKNILIYSSDSKLNTLIKCIHMISSGQIKVKKENFDALKVRHINLIKTHFESKSAVRKLLTEERDKKLKLLEKLSPCFHDLLFTFFNRLP